MMIEGTPAKLTALELARKKWLRARKAAAKFRSVEEAAYADFKAACIPRRP